MDKNSLKNFLKKNSFFFFLSIAALGIFDTLYLLYNELLHAGECQVLGGNCGEVLSSTYSRWLGLPLSVWGLIGYISFLELAFKARYRNRNYFLIFFLLSLGGTTFSWYLFYLQAVVIEAWCPLCLVSFGLNNAIFILLIILHFIYGKEEKAVGDKKVFFSSLKMLLRNVVVIVLLFKLTEDYLASSNTSENNQGNFETLIGIIDEKYITTSDVDPLIEKYIVIEKQTIAEKRKKALQFILVEQAAERENLSLVNYLIKEGVIDKREKGKEEKALKELIKDYYTTKQGNKELENLIAKLKQFFFYREVIE